MLYKPRDTRTTTTNSSQFEPNLVDAVKALDMAGIFECPIGIELVCAPASRPRGAVPVFQQIYWYPREPANPIGFLRPDHVVDQPVPRTIRAHDDGIDPAPARL